MINKSPTILAIESSCDDTSAAIISGGEVLSNLIANQEVHREYGGVVPELASRKHQENIVPVVNQAMAAANVRQENLDAIAFTHGPGLLGSLLVGCSFTKSMALALDIPLIGVNHMEAHIMAHFIEEPRPPYPFLCLTVSGGHTQLVIARDSSKMEVIGTTRDDAAGEAFDKIGKYLNLDYPAGPIIDRLAQQGQAKFPFPKAGVDMLEFSFSGLKTSVLYFLKKQLKKNASFIQENLNDICASVQHTIVSTLIEKIETAANMHGITHIAIAGGVSANSGLRQALSDKAKEKSWQVYIPKLEYCTDNAAMIAMAAHYKYLNEDFVDQTVTPEPRLKIG